MMGGSAVLTVPLLMATSCPHFHHSQRMASISQTVPYSR